MSQTRRNLLKAAAATPIAAAAKTAAKTDNVYTRLGVKPVINGMGTVTVLGGCLMPPEVLRAMDEAAGYFVQLPELERKAGQKIADLLGVPGAMVTGGAASGITVGTVACMCRGDQKKLQQLPEVTGMAHEVIQQKAHHSGYEHQITLTGAKVIEVETMAELEAAIGPTTAMMFFLNKAEPDGKISRAEWIRIAKKNNIPTLNDAAADVPPKERLWQYVKEGFDLVAFSGGKGMLGPQSAGLLLGRKDLIDASFPAMSPSGGIGRGMKVAKEEIIGMVAAVERFLKVDHEAEARELDRRVTEMITTLNKVAGVKVSKHVPVIANELPHFQMEWDEQASKITTKQLVENLQSGEPAIHVLPQGPGKIVVSVWMMTGQQHRIVAKRLGEIFRG